MLHFVHIPWPAPQYWKVLPASMRDSIVDGMLANDIVGFQSRHDARQFVLTCQENMQLRVNEREMSVIHRGHLTWVRSYPISIDPATLEHQAFGAGVNAEVERLRSWRPQRLIVRVDRTDPSKNIVRGFLAYERLLRNHPGLRKSVQFWAFLQPSRQDVAVYREYVREIRRTVDRINRELGFDGWNPIRLDIAESMRRALAAYREFDVMFVSSIFDGMNLVAKEAVAINERDGVLVLSENAGAFEELGEDALCVNPFDVDEMANALYQALQMPVEERRRRGARMRQIVRSRDIIRWITTQLQDVRDLRGPAAPT
jgi:trehalose 6-phosphate synthase